MRNATVNRIYEGRSPRWAGCRHEGESTAGAAHFKLGGSAKFRGHNFS